MEKAYEKARSVVSVGKDVQRNDGIWRKLPLDDHKEKKQHNAKDEEADDGCRIPRESNASELQAKEEHDGSPDDAERSNPVDGFQSIPQLGARGM